YALQYCMLRAVRKWLLCAATAYLMLATLGTFTFMAFDASVLDSLSGRSPSRDIFITSFSRLMRTSAIGGTKSGPFSPLRHCLQRTILPPGLPGAGLLCPAVKSAAKTAANANKNTVPLKLRI
ncbi:MAG: hypothetical protein LBH35_08445, partial [Treponema sp.]|nr:hypothetical protein [Treponema sp.]